MALSLLKAQREWGQKPSYIFLFNIDLELFAIGGKGILAHKYEGNLLLTYDFDQHTFG